MKKHLSFRQMSEKLTLAFRVRSRRKEARKNLLAKDHSLFKGLTPEQEREVRELWRKYGIKLFDIEWVDFLSTFNGRFDRRYIPEDLFFTKIDLFYCRTDACQHFDEKNNYSLIFQGVRMPHTVVRKVNGTFLDEHYRELTRDEAIRACQEEGHVIFKPTAMSSGGFGIFFWNTGDDVALLERKLDAPHDWIVQRVLRQHPQLSRLHPASINTVRIMSLYMDHEVHILSAIVRMGIDGKKVDNMSSGGIACGIMPDGRLRKYAFYDCGKKITRHPQGAVFEEVTIPHFDQCIGIVKTMALRLLAYSRLVSWDFSIDEEGNPVLIEANLDKGGLDFHQMANGPIFGDLTERVLDEVLLHGQ